MDYFRILNLNKEPFSNSPEPEFFYESPQHLSCLQKLELSIRLRRGLNVVIGDVGTGKTTLCRQLIRRFSTSEKDHENFGIHLILDPSFTTPVEFLRAVARTFDISYSVKQTELQIKEKIKDHLFIKGVDEGKTVVLIIDEGQKIPHFCLEILREFLNYETNDHKLLQIVIFAQKEFEEVIKAHANIADRINFYYFLKPLNLIGTRSMINYRLALAGNSDPRRAIFSLSGILAVYIFTGGYPRKIITLCHQAVLALIIQNKPRAGWFLISSCANRGLPPRTWKIRWVTATVVFMLFAVMVVAGFTYDSRSRTEKHVEFFPRDAERSASVLPELPEAAAPLKKQEAVKNQEILGQLTLRKGGSYKNLIRELYGDSNKERIQSFVRINPQIENLDNIESGEKINLPAAPVGSLPVNSGSYWIQLFSSNKLDETYRIFTSYPSNLPDKKLLAYRNSREGTVFSIVIKKGFKDRASAKETLWLLTPELSSSARIVDSWDEDTVFF